MRSISILERRINSMIGARLRQVRRSQKFSLIDFASMLGVSYQQLQKYEAGINRVSAAKLIILAYVLGRGSDHSFNETLDSILPEIENAIDVDDLESYLFSKK